MAQVLKNFFISSLYLLLYILLKFTKQSRHASESTGFNIVSNGKEIEYPRYVYDIIAENVPHYEYLRKHKIHV